MHACGAGRSLPSRTEDRRRGNPAFIDMAEEGEARFEVSSAAREFLTGSPRWTSLLMPTGSWAEPFPVRDKSPNCPIVDSSTVD